jgi:hypothetical protein
MEFVTYVSYHDCIQPKSTFYSWKMLLVVKKRFVEIFLLICLLIRNLPILIENITTEVQCVRKVAVHLQKLLEVMSTSVYTGLNPFNFIRKHFLQICLWDVFYVRIYRSF